MMTMGSTEKDSRRESRREAKREKARRLRYFLWEQDFNTKKNLSPDQRCWLEAYERFSPLLQGEVHDAPFFSVAFCANGPEQYKIAADNLVLPWQHVRAVILHREPPTESNEFWRFNMTTLPSSLSSEDPSDPFLTFSTTHLHELGHSSLLRQRDAFRQPFKPHSKFRLRSSVAKHGRNKTLTAPVGGKYTIETNELYLNIMIDDMPVYRFLIEDRSKVVFGTEQISLINTTVRKGETLGYCPEPVNFAELKAGDGPKGMSVPWALARDALVGEKEAYEIRLASNMLHGLADVIFDPAGSDTTLPASLDTWLPRHIVSVSDEEFTLLCQSPEALCGQPMFRRDLLQAAKAAGYGILAKSWESLSQDKEVLSQLASWMLLDADARRKSSGWAGDGPGVDISYLGQVLAEGRVKPTGHYLSFEIAARQGFLCEEFGAIIGPPTLQPNHKTAMHDVGWLVIDFTQAAELSEL